jgi:hypothetical protein
MTRQTLLPLLSSLVAVSCVAAASAPLLAEAASRPGTRPATAVQRAPGNAEPLSIDVYPRIVSDGYVSVRLRVEPHAMSRNLEVSWWSDDGLGGSRLLEVEGDRGAIRYEFPIKRIDPGEYEVSAVLIRSDGTRIRRSATILVVGRGF